MAKRNYDDKKAEKSFSCILIEQFLIIFFFFVIDRHIGHIINIKHREGFAITLINISIRMKDWAKEDVGQN